MAKGSSAARDAVVKYFGGDEGLADSFLASLWVEGFKVARLSPTELARAKEDARQRRAARQPKRRTRY